MKKVPALGYFHGDPDEEAKMMLISGCKAGGDQGS